MRFSFEFRSLIEWNFGRVECRMPHNQIQSETSSARLINRLKQTQMRKVRGEIQNTTTNCHGSTMPKNIPTQQRIHTRKEIEKTKRIVLNCQLNGFVQNKTAKDYVERTSAEHEENETENTRIHALNTAFNPRTGRMEHGSFNSSEKSVMNNE